MGLFERNQEKDLAQSEKTGNQTQEKQLQVGSIRIASSRDLIADHEDSHTAKSLWDCAYELLEKEDPQLVEKYENLLSEEAKTSTYQQPVMRSRRVRAIIQEGLQRVENMKTKYTIAGHEFVLGDQMAQAADLVLWAKCLIGEAVKSSPEASIAWAGVYIILPLLTNPRVADEANRDGFTYVTTRMKYYTALEPLLRRLGGNAGVTSVLMEEANGHIGSIKGYVKDVFSPKDWKQMRLNIENPEKTVNENFTHINELLSRQELKSLHENSKSALEIMERFQRKLLEQLQSQEQYLQLFRLTSSSKDATYEWYKDRVEDRDQDQNTVRKALCALLHQLLSQQPLLIKYAAEQFKENGSGLIDSTRLLWTILENAVQGPHAGSIILVLDALDECAELELDYLMLKLESQFCNKKSTGGKLKYLLTSRPYEQIVSKFQRLLDTFPVPHHTYLWVYLAFEHLNKEHFKKTIKGVDSTIATLPKCIYQAYEQILSKSKEDPMVRMALSIVLAATRPLTLPEMNIAVNIDDTARSVYDLDLEEEDDFKARLRSWCGLFVSIHHGLRNPAYDDDIYF
ncbi:ankyrin repeat protein [Penicillium cataractarum]|uniref:Ankyrin repeat protein n=1 Tax=Penicillium cataractarum TaxID=2100454 RepID=A0A9W9RH09_9EURO|nr:ankyrin repeat protein [Penicillium cataractarum]KAJ5359385.1 ankyrin repeat protein [Penicillium cataractarum]